LRTLRITLALWLLAIVAAPIGSAAQGGCKPAGYCGEAGRVQSQLTGKQAAGAQLPFTGLDVGVFAAAGAVLIGTGAAIRRASRPKS
jgi:hypothetical protein